MNTSHLATPWRMLWISQLPNHGQYHLSQLSHLQLPTEHPLAPLNIVSCLVRISNSRLCLLWRNELCYTASLLAIAPLIHKTNSSCLSSPASFNSHPPFAGSYISGIRDHNRTLSGLLHSHNASIILWTTSRSCSTGVDSHLAISLHFASISCRYDHSISSLRFYGGSSSTATSTISQSTSVACLTSWTSPTDSCNIL